MDDNCCIPQRALKHVSPVQALKDWHAKKPEFFKKRVYNQPGLDIYWVPWRLYGANWGAVFTPRVGTEVLVDFIDGDIDRPIVVGQLHNGQHYLPWPAGVDAGSSRRVSR